MFVTPKFNFQTAFLGSIMRKWTLAIAMVFFAIVASAGKAQKTLSSVVMGNADAILTKVEVAKYSGEALDGSAAAAEKLANFYGFIILDFEKELYWLQIGAEDGDVNAMHSYWVIARLNEDPDVRRRGLFWLKRAASLGDKQSLNALHKDLKL
jgi:hypothetical protein